MLGQISRCTVVLHRTSVFQFLSILSVGDVCVVFGWLVYLWGDLVVIVCHWCKCRV